MVLAPFAVHGEGFAHFNPYMFSGDFSLVGTVHSHPSGNISPSHIDMNYFFGRILMIVGYPFEGRKCVAAYDSNAEKLPIEVTDPIGFDSEEPLEVYYKHLICLQKVKGKLVSVTLSAPMHFVHGFATEMMIKLM